MFDSEDEVLLLYAMAKSKKKKLWVHEINKRRDQYGEYHRLCRELETHEDRFFKYFRMSRDCFEEIHDLISQGIIKCTTNWRRPISTRERLVVCLRYVYFILYILNLEQKLVRFFIHLSYVRKRVRIFQ